MRGVVSGEASELGGYRENRFGCRDGSPSLDCQPGIAPRLLIEKLAADFSGQDLGQERRNGISNLALNRVTAPDEFHLLGEGLQGGEFSDRQVSVGPMK